jgi:acyl-CoA synthetase (AMP-forming)/AMP-acid ligase II
VQGVEGLHAARMFPAFVRALACTHGDRAALDVEGLVVTYRELEERSAELARGLLHRGVGKGSRVAMIFANGPEFAIAMAAIMRIGAVAVPLSTLYRPPELARVLLHGDVRAVLSQEAHLGQDFASNLARAIPSIEGSAGEPLCLAEMPFLRWVAFLDGDIPPAWAHDAGWLRQGAAAGFGDELLRAAEAQVHPDDPALLVYTSGQSAEPKGVVHAHGGILQKTHHLRERFGFEPDSRVPGGLPFFWVGGLVMALLTVFDAGGTVVCRRSPLSDAPMLGAVGASRPDFKARGARMHMLVGLGMTETFGPYSWGRDVPHPDRPLCPPLVAFEPGYDIKVIDAEGNQVPDGGTGEIALRGPTVMLGLHKVDRASTFDADGFYRTGDRAEVGGDTLYFVGRLGDMIKVAGANVAPAEVERELLAVGGIAAAHVVGVEDADRGQVVGAAVVLADGASLDRSAVVLALRDRLSSYKVPRILELVTREEIPVLPTGKIARRDLAALLRTRSSKDSGG